MWQKKDDCPSVSIVYGFLRTCRRKLYLINNDQKCTIASPVSVMDFFVHLSVQKQGYALVLFNNMLEAEKVEPYQCAYDKPSASLLKFLHKVLFSLLKRFYYSKRMEGNSALWAARSGMAKHQLRGVLTIFRIAIRGGPRIK